MGQHEHVAGRAAGGQLIELAIGPAEPGASVERASPSVRVTVWRTPAT